MISRMIKGTEEEYNFLLMEVSLKANLMMIKEMAVVKKNFLMEAFTKVSIRMILEMAEAK